MRALLPAVLVLAVAAQGCRSADAAQTPSPVRSSAIGDLVKVELLRSGTLTRNGLVQEYQVTNQGPGAIYFIRPEALFGDKESDFALPFHELHESSELSVYSYFAYVPPDPDNYRYLYTLRRVEPGKTFRGTLEIAAPLKFNPPYPPPVFQPYPIDGFWVDRIRLTLGVLPCPNANLKVDSSGDVRGFDELTVIACGSSQREARSFQQLITVERGIQYTGCWPAGPGRPTTGSCEQQEEAEQKRHH